MHDRTADRRRRETIQKALSYGLTALLAAFSVWCIVLLARTQNLRRDLDLQLGWVDDVRRLRGELERLGPGSDARVDGARGLLEDLRAHAGAGGGGPELQVAVQGLRGALRRLREQLDARRDAPGEDTPDDVWEASVATLAAVSALEGQIQSQVSQLYGRLGSQWTAINLLIVASLLLAGSNLALLKLAHRRRGRLEDAHAEVLREASLDPLTRLWNREAILNLLRRELVRSRRLAAPLGVILADVDRFKQVNVRLGQDQGDFILEQLALRLTSLVRPYDTLGRFDGDSFLVVLPICDEIATANVAGRLLEAVNERDMDHALGKIRITISLAHLIADPEEVDADLLIHRLQQMIERQRATPSAPETGAAGDPV